MSLDTLGDFSRTSGFFAAAAPGVKAAAFGLNGLKALAFALSLNELALDTTPLAGAAGALTSVLTTGSAALEPAAAAAAAAWRAFARSGLKGGIFGIVMLASIAFVSAKRGPTFAPVVAAAPEPPEGLG